MVEGEQIETIVIEPVELPVPASEPAPEPEPVEVPVEPDKVPA
jgi:hypothetical protein